MNSQHNMPFLPWHKLRMLHLVKPHSPLHLKNTLTLHTLTTQQDQQRLAPLRPDPVNLQNQIVRNLLTGSLHCAWNAHIHSPALDKNTWPSCTSISQEHAHSKISLSQGSECLHQLHLDIICNPFCFKFTYKEFPENSASWLDSSLDHPHSLDHLQRIVITRDAYFDKDMTSSAYVFNSKNLLLEPSPSTLI
jgi:hypothetical protein